jgi:UDP-N-acetylmuramoyl-tripeptide--D-alanyl-D-alanine ligase
MNPKASEVWLAAASGFSSDTRTLQKGDVFVALKGAQIDAHEYLVDLAKNPSLRGFLVRETYFHQNEKTLLALRPREDFFLCEDTHVAHRLAAAHFRKRFKGTVIGIGGSSGKTSAKEFTYQILQSMGFLVVATEKSQNGELGIPRTLEKLRNSELAVVEIGIDGPGDMIRHEEIVRPDIAVLTSIGEEHLNLLKNLEGVFREEKILVDSTLARGGRAFAPGADAWLSKYSGRKGVSLTPERADQVDPSFKVTLPGAFPQRNAALAAAVVLALYPGKKTAIAEALLKLKIPEGRGQIFSNATGATWIEDHYNANPSSMRAALTQISDLRKTDSRPLTLILGDMLDLGEATQSLHDALVPDLQKVAAEEIIFIGPQMSRLAAVFKKTGIKVLSFADSETAAKELAFTQWKNRLLLFKGSRGMALEKIIGAFKKS